MTSPQPKTAIITVHEAFAAAMNSYPSLYASQSVERAKLKVYDQIFNVIGNGYNDQDDFEDEFRFRGGVDQQIKGYPLKYVSGEPLFSGYTEIDTKFNYGSHVFPKLDSEIEGLFAEWEKDLHPEVKVWQDHRFYDNEWTPYPNFQKEYSLLWTIDVDSLDASWLSEAMWFYDQCKVFFASDASSKYHSAWPSTQKEQDALVGQFEARFPQYRKEGMSDDDYHAAISKAYESPYRGDTPLFIQERWAIEKNRILAFIEETQGMLTQKLNAQVDSNLSM